MVSLLRRGAVSVPGEAPPGVGAAGHSAAQVTGDMLLDDVE